jgi:SpoVK/Ycf46/Vps4 family AAA+-type ATPase
MEQIHSKADEIFRRLMELDHAVILFDEIDELVREREGGQEAFGRFLTTSMLPKLAELWQQRKTLYFVATNHIMYFDRAITRSERFDALILVAPPSYQKKTTTLKQLLGTAGGEYEFLTEESEVWSELKQAGDGDTHAGAQALRNYHMLAKFVLLRHDQLSELAVNIRESLAGSSRQIKTESLRDALSAIRDKNLAIRKPYLEFLQDISYRRRDYDKYQVWRVEGLEAGETAPEPVYRDSVGNSWLKTENGVRPPQEIGGREIEIFAPGTLNLRPRG